MSDHDEDALQHALANAPGPRMARPRDLGGQPVDPAPGPPLEGPWSGPRARCWATADDRHFFPEGRTVPELKPGLYDIGHCQRGLYFERIDIKTESLLRFPDANSDLVLAEIERFWRLGDAYERNRIPHRRGILLYGPPGSGKSCTAALLLQDVIARGGIGIRFTNPGLFVGGVRALRAIQPETPVVALLEDMDSLIVSFDESAILQILDGVEGLTHVVFLATTNYPELLGPRIVNRPSRFDKRFRIGMPSAVARRAYFEDMFKRDGGEYAPATLDAWAADTADLSFAHMKELYVAVMILGDDYAAALSTLKRMRDAPKAGNGRAAPGFLDQPEASA